MMADLIMLHRGLTDDLRSEAFISQLIIIIALGGLYLAELICYIVLFVHLYKSDISALKKGIITMDSVVQRHKKNALTLSGQAVVSFIEIMLPIIGVLMMSLGKLFGLDQTYSPIVILVTSSGISVATIVTSPELRRHFWNA